MVLMFNSGIYWFVELDQELKLMLPKKWRDTEES